MPREAQRFEISGLARLDWIDGTGPSIVRVFHENGQLSLKKYFPSSGQMGHFAVV
jgi:hypothetical protein